MADKEDYMKWPGVSLISFERSRQITAEGYTKEHDDEHDTGNLIRAAVAYALEGLRPEHPAAGAYWPWLKDSWKPSPDRIRNLVKAGALIAAEIDRLQRIKADA